MPNGQDILSPVLAVPITRFSLPHEAVSNILAPCRWMNVRNHKERQGDETLWGYRLQKAVWLPAPLGWGLAQPLLRFGGDPSSTDRHPA